MFVEGFIKYIMAEKRYSSHTCEAYRRDVVSFVSFVEDAGGEPFSPSNITSGDIREWIVSLSEGGLAASTVNRKVSSLSSFFRWLRKTKAISGDPFKRVGLQKTPSRLPSYVTEEQMGALISQMRESEDGDDFITVRDRVILLMFYATGIRLSELQAVRLDDFSEGLAELKVSGKGNKQRVVPVLPALREEIRHLQVKIKEEDICISDGFFLFLTKKGKRISRTEIYNVVRSKLSEAGVQGKRSPHVLRHTFATHMLNDGADMREIQELLGHNALSTTQVYTHNSIARLKEVYRSSHPRSAGKKKEG